MTSSSAHIHYDVVSVQEADPLIADSLLAELPAMNAAADTRELAELLITLSGRARALCAHRLPPPVQGLAVMRDLGIVLGSIKRHGTEPLDVVPELTPLLLALGRQTDLVPRDTVQHYTSWNPPGARRRTYTDDEQETWLQDSVSHVFPDLSASLSISETLVDLDPRDTRFAANARLLARTVHSMLEAIDSVTARVSPIFFAQEMRPYFEEITVDGTEYLGPAAAQVPLWLVDLCLWASDRNADAYGSFLSESLQYALPDWRDFHGRHHHRPSLVTRLSNLMMADPRRTSPALIESAKAVGDLLRTLKTFRGRHITIAKKAYAEDVRLYENGSGGAPIALLQEILDLTRENENLIRSRHRPAPRAAGAA
ncbi:monodechloroaminopyrrolnitrin synthase PrnB family protein [Luteipulveratus mongoliensis]|nr:monodechloroaminopyrrolnitrin synthase PrnB family protein [Luteipulveratus mongoliensis]